MSDNFEDFGDFENSENSVGGHSPGNHQVFMEQGDSSKKNTLLSKKKETDADFLNQVIREKKKQEQSERDPLIRDISFGKEDTGQFGRREQRNSGVNNLTRVEEIDLESQPSPSIIKKSEFIEAREVYNKTKGQASSMSGVRPAAQSQGATNGETTGASNNEGYDFQTYMEELIKQKNRKDQEKDTGGGLAPTFLDPRADRFNTPSTKKAQTQPSKRKGKKRNEHVERVLTNIGTGGEKIYKLSELYRPGDPKILKNCMEFIEKHSGMRILKEFEANCLLEPFDLNEQYREFEKNIRGAGDEGNKEHEDEQVQEEEVELREFYSNERGQVEKYWDQMIPNSQSLCRIFKKRMIRPQGQFAHLNHVEMESVLFRRTPGDSDYPAKIALSKRNDREFVQSHLRSVYGDHLQTLRYRERLLKTEHRNEMIENPRFYTQLIEQFSRGGPAPQKKLHFSELLDSLIEQRKKKIKNENQHQKTKDFEKKRRGLRKASQKVPEKKPNPATKVSGETPKKKGDRVIPETEEKGLETKVPGEQIVEDSGKKKTAKKEKKNTVYETMFEAFEPSSSEEGLFGEDNEEGDLFGDDSDDDSEDEPKEKNLFDSEKSMEEEQLEDGPLNLGEKPGQPKEARKESLKMEKKQEAQVAGPTPTGKESEKIKRIKAKLEQIHRKRRPKKADQSDHFASEKEYLRSFNRKLLEGSQTCKIDLNKRRTFLKGLRASGPEVFGYTYLEHTQSKSGQERVDLKSPKPGEEGRNMIGKLESALGICRREVPASLDLSLKGRGEPTFRLRDSNPGFQNTNIVKACLNGYWDYREELISKTLPYVDLNDPYFRSLVENFNRQKLLGQRREDAQKPTIYDITKNRSDAMQVKKQYRMIMAEINKGSSFANLEDLKRLKDNIVYDRDCEIGNLLGFNKIEDFKANEEIIKNRKRRVKAIHHTPVADKFMHHDFVIKPKKVVSLYRYDFRDEVISNLFFMSKSPLRYRVVNAAMESNLRNKLSRCLSSKKTFLPKKRSEKILEPHLLFKNAGKLSLNSDDFFLFEYVEQHPLVLSALGMGSRLERVVYPSRVAYHVLEKKLKYKSETEAKNPKKRKKQKFSRPGQKKGAGEKNVLNDKKKLVRLFKETIIENFGENGEEVYNSESMSLPTIGQLNKTNYLGVNLLENNLSLTPVFPQKTRRNDFLLVVSKAKGRKRYFIRRIKNCYTAGQIQPKKEVFSPYSRDYNKFQSKFLRFYIKQQFAKASDSRVNIERVKEVFPNLNDHNIKHQIRLCGGKVDQENSKLYYQNRESVYEQEEMAGDQQTQVSPEEICLYERMNQSFHQLKALGIVELKSTDKIADLRTKFYKKTIDTSLPDSELYRNVFRCMVAKRIIEEIQLTAWNLSQNFLFCKNQQARMYLTGIGDPMRGLGGVNYIKYPQKLSKYETFLQNKNKRNRSEEIVTGTNSDLRKLPMKEVHAKLKRHGYTEENLSKLERWDKIEILRDLANKQSQSQLYDDDLKKYSRNLRMTTDKQKEQYQKDINELFMRTINTLSRKGPPPALPKVPEQSVFGSGFDSVKDAILQSIEKLRAELPKVKKEKHNLIYELIEKKKQDILELRKCEEFLGSVQFLPSQEAFFHPDVISDVWWEFKRMLQELQDYKSFDLNEQREQANPRTRKKKEKAIVLKDWIQNKV